MKKPKKKLLITQKDLAVITLCLMLLVFLPIGALKIHFGIDVVWEDGRLLNHEFSLKREDLD